MVDTSAKPKSRVQWLALFLFQGSRVRFFARRYAVIKLLCGFIIPANSVLVPRHKRILYGITLQLFIQN